jgi:hypothetical protein
VEKNEPTTTADENYGDPNPKYWNWTSDDRDEDEKKNNKEGIKENE